MKMTKEEFDLAGRYVRSELVVWKCRTCGGNEYALESSVYDLCSFSEGVTVERSLPVIVLICEKCGLIQMVSAVAAGIRS